MSYLGALGYGCKEPFLICVFLISVLWSPISYLDALKFEDWSSDLLIWVLS